ncbi:MAG: 8-oxo-dGTP diphosphatase [Nanoarchaeota archaeon]
MSIEEYLKTLNAPLWKSTLCFLLRSDEILLGKKKRGIGLGNYLGIGGKVEKEEGIIKATVREMQEEIGVTPNNLQKVAVLTFLFPYEPKWNQEVHAFIGYNWEGLPRETEEIAPRWFNLSKIPYDKMWADAQFWVPEVLKGNKIIGTFQYDRDLKISHQRIINTDNLD